MNRNGAKNLVKGGGERVSTWDLSGVHAALPAPLLLFFLLFLRRSPISRQRTVAKRQNDTRQRSAHLLGGDLLRVHE
jgi:hypothetical protein